MDRLVDDRACGHAAGAPQDERHVRELAVGRVAVEHLAVLEELLAVVRRAGHERPAIQPEAPQAFEQPADLDVHAADGAVVPAALVIDVGLGIEAGLHEVLAAGHHERAHGGIGDDLPHLARLPLVLLRPRAVGP